MELPFAAITEQYIEELKKNCIESMATSYKHRRIEELKEKIYK